MPSILNRYFNLIVRYRVAVVVVVRFIGQIKPSSKKVTYHIDIKRIVNRKLNIGIADGKTFVDSKEIYFAKELRVCLVAEANDENSSVRCGGERTVSLA